MRFHVDEEPISQVGELARIPISFVVSTVLVCSVEDRGLGGIMLSERTLDEAYTKDYDTFGTEGPTTWARRFDVSRWAFLSAYDERERIGGAVVAFDSPEVHVLEGRRDMAVVWDIRVAPRVRGRGVGSALFRRVEDWAARKGCLRLKVETQNTNVPACRFYARQGCELGGINRFAYPELPHEIQLLWYKDLIGKSG